MGLEQFKNRNVGQQEYVLLDAGQTPKTGMDQFRQVVRRTFKGELFVGLWVTMREMINALFKGQMHTVKYPFEKLPISPRYRAIHEMLRLLESGHYRCIGCGLCEKICIANCITMDTRYDENQRKEVSEYTINFGRCIFCGYCAEVCPELAMICSHRSTNSTCSRSSTALVP
jgi:NADH-quinone oxidoreductase subunit I